MASRIVLLRLAPVAHKQWRSISFSLTRKRPSEPMRRYFKLFGAQSLLKAVALWMKVKFYCILFSSLCLVRFWDLILLSSALWAKYLRQRSAFLRTFCHLPSSEVTLGWPLVKVKEAHRPNIICLCFSFDCVCVCVLGEETTTVRVRGPAAGHSPNQPCVISILVHAW